MERRSPLWRKLVEHYEARLQVLREKNDNSMTNDESEKLRGRIVEVKVFLGLDSDGPEIESDDLKDLTP